MASFYFGEKQAEEFSLKWLGHPAARANGPRPEVGGAATVAI